MGSWFATLLVKVSVFAGARTLAISPNCSDGLREARLCLNFDVRPDKNVFPTLGGISGERPPLAVLDPYPESFE